MSSKIPPRYPKRKIEKSPNIPKFKDGPEKNFIYINGRKTETQVLQKISSTYVFGDVDLPISSEHQKEEKSKGVENFEVSNVKEKLSSNTLINRPQSVVSTLTDNKNLREKLSEENKELKKNKDSNKSIQCVGKKSERSLKMKKQMACRIGRRKDQNDKNQQIKHLSSPKNSVTFKRTKNQGENPHLLVENKSYSNTEAISKKSTSKIVESKKRKPSEIPLRKSRINGGRKPKPLSTLLKKTVKEDESLSDFYSENKPCTPTDEVSPYSELQITIDAISDSEISGDTDAKPPKQELCKRHEVDEKVFNFTLERSSKHSNIHLDCVEEKPPSRGKKMKKLDLEKVKTSSFTVLQTDPSALDRLESLHKQNVLGKKKVNAVNQKKSKSFSYKQLFNSVKKRSSRSLSPRLTGIKNKSNSLIKLKKSKIKIPEKTPSPNVIETDLKILSEFVSDKKVNLIPSYLKTKTKSNQISNTNETLTKEELSKSLREKLVRWDKKLLDKIRTPEEKEESKIPTPKKLTYFQDFKNENTGNLETSKSRRVESFGYSKPKITTHLVPDHDEKIINEDKQGNKNTPGKPEEKPTGSEKENLELVVKGTALKLQKDESVEKINSETKVKVQLKIDLSLQQEVDENSKNKFRSFNWLFKNDANEPSEKSPNLEKVENSCSGLPDLLPLENTEVTEKLENIEPSTNRIESDSNLEEKPKNGSLLRENFLNRTSSLKTKEVRKKNRSDAGDRRLPPLNSFLTSNFPPQNKVKVEHKVRKSYNREDKREIFEEEAPVKLRRRVSEPISLSGYIWKKSNFPIFRGYKPSVSSLASSLKHLNTDDFEDFMFWEPVPHKMTSSWEMSLYQFKKSWSVLSCSIFRDNRLSDTPGLILENLRNGGNLSKRPSAGSHNERRNHVKENLFDVEPSIAQKNIDIRNWLAALNFPTASSNRSDVITEGCFTAPPTQPILDSSNVNKAQVTPKRRRVLRNSKFPDKGSKIVTKDKNQCSRIVRNSKEELNVKGVRRGLSSRSAEEKSVLKKIKNRNTSSEPKVSTKPQVTHDLETAESGTTVDETLSQPIDKQQKFQEFYTNLTFLKFSKFKFIICNSLFMFALFIIVISFFLLVVYPIVSVDFIHC